MADLDKPFDTIVVGGGPAGSSAALVLGRCRRRVLVCDSGRYRNQSSDALHCFLGLEGVAPAVLLDTARRQLDAYDVERLQDIVTEARAAPEGFRVSLASGLSATARTLMVATGVVDEIPPLPGIDALYGKSVHVCPYCDGWECRDKSIAVYGRGEKAAGLARMLRQWSRDIVLTTHGPAQLAYDDERRLDQAGIVVREERITKLEGRDGKLERLIFERGPPLTRDALFFSTGQHPRSPLLERLGCRFDEKGGVEASADGETSVTGVFVAGDVSRDVQIAIIAAAEGARAALAINRTLMYRDGLV
jgi:thioredoxin reductase